MSTDINVFFGIALPQDLHQSGQEVLQDVLQAGRRSDDGAHHVPRDSVLYEDKSRILNLLSEQGFVTKVADGHDGAGWWTMTDTGREKLTISYTASRPIRVLSVNLNKNTNEMHMVELMVYMETLGWTSMV